MSGKDAVDVKLGEAPGSVTSSTATTANDPPASKTIDDKDLIWFMEELEKLEAEAGERVTEPEAQEAEAAAHDTDLEGQKNYLIEARRAGMSCPQLFHSGRLTAPCYHSVSAIAYQLRKLEKAGVDVEPRTLEHQLRSAAAKKNRYRASKAQWESK
ncbi:MAG: hypothetical protein Q9201_000407 [Fulgogasparrea decipioides]